TKQRRAQPDLQNSVGHSPTYKLQKQCRAQPDLQNSVGHSPTYQTVSGTARPTKLQNSVGHSPTYQTTKQRRAQPDLPTCFWLNHFLYRRGVVEQVNGAARVVVDRRLRVDAQVIV